MDIVLEIYKLSQTVWSTLIHLSEDWLQILNQSASTWQRVYSPARHSRSFVVWLVRAQCIYQGLLSDSVMAPSIFKNSISARGTNCPGWACLSFSLVKSHKCQDITLISPCSEFFPIGQFMSLRLMVHSLQYVINHTAASVSYWTTRTSHTFSSDSIWLQVNGW